MGPTQAPHCFACRAELFFNGVLLRPQGMRLPPWQLAFVRKLLGTVDSNGARVYRDSYVEVAKKNYKSFLGGGLAAYALFFDPLEEYPHVYGAASAKTQAGLVFESARRLISASVLLSKAKILPSAKRINTRDGKGFYQVLAADGDIADGIEPSLFIMDELHRWRYAKSETLYDIGMKGMITRKNPLAFKITTAGDEHESPMCWAEHLYAMRVKAGEIQAPSYLPVMFSADEKRHHADPEYWKSKAARVAANPSHEDNGGWLRDEALVTELNKAIEIPSKRPSYIRYHLNIWARGNEQFMPMEAWAAAKPTKALVGRRCIAALDFSATTDLTAMALLFEEEDESLDVVVFFWMAEAQLAKRQKLDRFNYSGCIGDELELCPGEVIQYSFVERKLQWIRDVFELDVVCYDPWNTREFVQRMSAIGYPMEEVPQTFTKLSSPMKYLEQMVLQGKLRHDNKPLLNWCMSNLTAATDSNDNIRPAKPDRLRDTVRIDGASAVITGLAKIAGRPGFQSIYDTPELVEMLNAH